jgi:Leucine-rich repeat (LRR) protein
MKTLTQLFLNDNRLTALPPSIGELTNLKYLCASTHTLFVVQLSYAHLRLSFQLSLTGPSKTTN